MHFKREIQPRATKQPLDQRADYKSSDDRASGISCWLLHRARTAPILLDVRSFRSSIAPPNLIKMKVFALVLALACTVQCGPAKTKKQVYDQEAESYDYGYVTHPEAVLVDSHLLEPSGHGLSHASSHHVSEHHAHHPGFSVGGPLASIAQGAAEQAHTQLGNQHSAAGQAAYMAKNTLAQAASQSAATAAAALAGKQIIVMGLEQQSRDAHAAVDGEKLQLQQAQRSAAAAQNTAQQAMHQVQVITAALNAAQATSDHANQAAAEAQAELAAQTSMVGQAKSRAETIDEQLTAARVDYEATQAAAQKAANAASAAQSNAAAAAAHAANAAAANDSRTPQY
ncbi:hypothetical protein KPH14_001934 [Odynerus spinipes]|uniref:Uncharacterized protein n=1 Tax=Odynerus spinipes TaxID=1348599 RepID=A0AAD9S0S1_9HYME|nr:hypothetical protein KPH14_001934 [Odynerus spinipes]